MIRGLLTGLALVAGLSACATTESSMSRWAGATREQVVLAWGEPDGETPLRDSRIVLTWLWAWGYWPVRGVCRQSFTLDGDGIVEAWSYSKCPLLHRPRRVEE